MIETSKTLMARCDAHSESVGQKLNRPAQTTACLRRRICEESGDFYLFILAGESMAVNSRHGPHRSMGLAICAVLYSRHNGGPVLLVRKQYTLIHVQNSWPRVNHHHNTEYSFQTQTRAYTCSNNV